MFVARNVGGKVIGKQLTRNNDSSMAELGIKYYGI